MVILNLRSSELQDLAEALLAIAGTLETQFGQRTASWNHLPGFTDAESLLAGIQRLHHHNAPLAETADRITRASQILLSTAGAIRVLETYLNMMEKITDYSPAVTVFLHQIAHLGDLVDFVCAQQIDALCTPFAPAPLKYLGDFGDLPATAIHEFNLINAPPHIHALIAENPEITLLEVGDGTLVAAFGDIDHAEAVATIVAGVSSSERDHWQGNLNRAHTIHRATGAATVLWLGYTAPATVPLATSQRAAKTGADDLRRFQDTLATRKPDQRRVAIGHSYGSVVVGNGASQSTRGFDAVVLVGSPGAGVGHAREINAEVYAVTGTRDPIGLTATSFGGIHGTDPTSPWFKSTIWESGATHSGYWEDPAFLRNLKDVIRR